MDAFEHTLAGLTTEPSGSVKLTVLVLGVKAADVYNVSPNGVPRLITQVDLSPVVS